MPLSVLPVQIYGCDPQRLLALEAQRLSRPGRRPETNSSLEQRLTLTRSTMSTSVALLLSSDASLVATVNKPLTRSAPQT